LSPPGASSPTVSADCQSASTSPAVNAGLALVFFDRRWFNSARPVLAADALRPISRLDGRPCTSATVLRGRSKFGFFFDASAAPTPATSTEATALPTVATTPGFLAGLAALRRSAVALEEALADMRGAGLDALRADFLEAFFGALAVRRAAFLGAAFFFAILFADFAFAFFAAFFRAMSRSFPAALTVCAK
jgi:hypothetical protein